MSMDYNKKQAEKYGWDPSWFGCEEFDSDLLEAIKKFQNKDSKYNVPHQFKKKAKAKKKEFKDIYRQAMAVFK